MERLDRGSGGEDALAGYSIDEWIAPEEFRLGGTVFRPHGPLWFGKLPGRPEILYSSVLRQMRKGRFKDVGEDTLTFDEACPGRGSDLRVRRRHHHGSSPIGDCTHLLMKRWPRLHRRRSHCRIHFGSDTGQTMDLASRPPSGERGWENRRFHVDDLALERKKRPNLKGVRPLFWEGPEGAYSQNLKGVGLFFRRARGSYSQTKRPDPFVSRTDAELAWAWLCANGSSGSMVAAFARRGQRDQYGQNRIFEILTNQCQDRLSSPVLLARWHFPTKTFCEC